MEHRFAKSLAWNGARCETGSTNGAATLDQGNALAQLSRLDGAALARGTTANADEIVVEGVAH